jgi:hypothetical protein
VNAIARSITRRLGIAAKKKISLEVGCAAAVTIAIAKFTIIIITTSDERM